MMTTAKSELYQLIQRVVPAVEGYNDSINFQCPLCSKTAEYHAESPWVPEYMICTSRCPEADVLDALGRLDRGEAVTTMTTTQAPPDVVPILTTDDGPPRCTELHLSSDSDRNACITCVTRRLWVAGKARAAVRDMGGATRTSTLVAGGGAILDLPENPVAVWGVGSRVLQAEGEALVIVGGSGVGKTTIANQWSFGRIGVPGYGTLLDLPIAPGSKKLLYLAMDRPKQALRSMRRMVTEEHRQLLDERLVIWPGPPPSKFTTHPEALLELCQRAGADSVVVDSLKDTGSVVDDEGGTGWNTARQLCLSEGIEVLELHHNRKDSAGTLEDVYGSAWISNGAGSVIALVGKPGDSVVELRHLKQPMDDIGPLKVLHDHTVGRSAVYDQLDLVAMASRPGGVTVAEVAEALFDTRKPDANEKEKARRRLTAAVKSGELTIIEKADKGRNRPARYGVGGVS